MFTPSNRQKTEDQRVEADLLEVNLSNHLFVRLGAKSKKLTKVDFRYSIFDTCYLRNCSFDSCDFTGCRFVGSNFNGSSFSGCKFEYAIFERTVLDADVLMTSCPGPENLKLRFARTLRMNFQQLGDAISANKAIAIELQATEVHLHKSWRSPESYYRAKYKGLGRLKVFFEWLEFKFLDLIWGNGESALKLLRTTAAVLIFITLVDAAVFNDPTLTVTFKDALIRSPQIFFGTLIPKNYPGFYSTTVLAVRLTLFALFMSTLIKRFNRR
jgi:hypothetical protein